MYGRSTCNSTKFINQKTIVLEFMAESFTKSKLEAKNDEINNLVGTSKVIEC